MLRRMFLLSSGLSLGLLVAAAWPAGSGPGGGGDAASPWPELAAFGPGRLQDETSRRLAEVVIHYDPGQAEELVPVYGQFLPALEPGTIVHVVVPDRAAFDDLDSRLQRDGHRVRARLEPEPVGRQITGWAKDRFLSWVPENTAEPERVLLVPPKPLITSPARAGDWAVPADLAARSDGRLGSAIVPLVFDGGDFAGADDCVFAGWTLMSKNPALAAAGPGSAGRTLSGLLGRPVILLGERPGDVPEHHVNMYALPLGARRALVGDVRMAERLSGWARLVAAGIQPDLSPERAVAFDRVAAGLEREGFAVTRIPVVPLAGGGDYGPYMTYTNALVETVGEGRRRVYLPVYGLEELDRAAIETWRGLGFEIRTVNVSPIWRRGGTLDCLVGVVSRAPAMRRRSEAASAPGEKPAAPGHPLPLERGPRIEDEITGTWYDSAGRPWHVHGRMHDGRKTYTLSRAPAVGDGPLVSCMELISGSIIQNGFFTTTRHSLEQRDVPWPDVVCLVDCRDCDVLVVYEGVRALSQSLQNMSYGPGIELARRKGSQPSEAPSAPRP